MPASGTGPTCAARRSSPRKAPVKRFRPDWLVDAGGFGCGTALRLLAMVPPWRVDAPCSATKSTRPRLTQSDRKRFNAHSIRQRSDVRSLGITLIEAQDHGESFGMV